MSSGDTIPPDERPRLLRRLLGPSGAGADRYTLRFIWAQVRRHRRVLAAAFALSLLAALFEGGTMGILVLALQSLTLEDGGTLAAEFGRLGQGADLLMARIGREGLFVVLLGAAVVAQLMRSALQFGASVAAAYLQAYVEGDVRRQVFRQFMTMSYAQTRRFKVGDLSSYMEQVSYVGRLIDRVSVMTTYFLLTVTYVAVLFWLSWGATVLVLSVLLLFSLMLRLIVRRVRRIAGKYKRTMVRVSERTVEFLGGLRLLHTFNRQALAFDRVNGVITASVQAKRRGAIWQSTLAPIVEALTTIGIALFLLAAILLLGDAGQSVIPRAATFIFVVYRMMPRVSILNKYWGVLNTMWPFVERIAEMLRQEDKEYLENGTAPFGGLREDVVFRGVSLQYNEVDRAAVKDLSFRIPRGHMVALVGLSGAGKSTIADLLLRLYDPTSGAVEVDGVNLRDFDVETWRDRIGVVSQEAFILHASIGDNIRFGKLDATEAEVEAAARAAHAHAFIMEMDQGYDTVVGDEGYRLSGGQRQRLAIARALVRNPEILVLDEATSDLDSQAEKHIQEAVNELHGQRTIIAIAHRLSTVAGADLILVLDQGRIIEQGTHDALMAQGGVYASLFLLQSGVGQDNTTLDEVS